jgi:hypothetical protein
MASISCTHCGAVLKTANAPAPGKKVKCSKCGKAFVIPDDEDETEPDESAADEDQEEEAPKSKKPAKAATDDDDDAEDDKEETPKKKDKKAAKGKQQDDEEEEPKKKSSMGLILGLVGGGAALLLLCCCGGGGACIMTSDLKDAKWGTVDRSEKPMVTTSAEELAKELIADDPAFHKKYSSRKVTVTGEVKEVHRNTFYLKGAKKDQIAVNPSVSLKDKEKQLRLGPGQKIKVTGTCLSQQLHSIQIFDAEFTLDGPKTLIEVSAADLAREYEANAGAADGKYKDKEMLVSGTIGEVKGTSIQLKGTAKTSVGVNVTGDEEKAKDLKTGQQAELRGKLLGYFPEQKSIAVMGGLVVSAK